MKPETKARKDAEEKRVRQERIEEIRRERIKEGRKLTPTEAAEYLRMSPATLQNWRRDRRGPTYTKTGYRVFYSIADLEAFERRIEL